MTVTELNGGIKIEWLSNENYVTTILQNLISSTESSINLVTELIIFMTDTILNQMCKLLN